MTQSHQRPWIGLALSIAIFFIYILWPGNFSSGDSRWTLPTALSLRHQGDAELSEFQKVMIEADYSLYTDANGRMYNYFPIGTSLLTIPPALVAEVLIERALPGINLYDHTQNFRALGVELVIASLITAAAAGLFYALAARHLPLLPAIFVTLVFALGTGAWSMTSRTLWMHGPLLMVFTALIYAMLLSRQQMRWLFIVGVLTAFGYVVRPTASVWVVVISLYVLWQYRKQSLIYFSGAAVIAIPFILYNLSIYQMLLPPYYEASRIALHDRFIEALLGNLISPSRGVLFFSPVLFAAIWGAYRHWRMGRWQSLDTAFWAGIVLHWVAVSSFPGWWGGTSNGPRFMLDILPFLMLYIVYALVGIQPLTGSLRTAAQSTLGVLAAVSIFIHGSMAISPQAQLWDTAPMSIERDTRRLWDWLDPAFLRPYRSLEDTPTAMGVNNLRFEFDNPFDLYVAEGLLQWVETTPSGRHFQWMSTPNIVIYLPLVRHRELSLELSIANSIQPDLLDTLEVIVNDVPLELNIVDEIEGMPVYRGIISRDILSNRNAYTRIEIQVERTYRPVDLGIGEDTRELAIALDYLQIRPYRPPEDSSSS